MSYLETHIGDDDLPVTVEYEFYPGEPAKIFGLPEDCYPAEGPEINIVSVEHNGVVISVSPADKELLEERCVEAGENELQSYEEQKADYLQQGD